jgi:hypothetical protein
MFTEQLCQTDHIKDKAFFIVKHLTYCIQIYRGGGGEFNMKTLPQVRQVSCIVAYSLQCFTHLMDRLLL